MSAELDPKMKITIWPTEHFFKTDEGWSVRAWKGWDQHGNSIIAFVAAVSYNADADLGEVQNVLIPIPGPLAEPLPLPVKKELL